MQRRSLVALLGGCLLATAFANGKPVQAKTGEPLVVFAASSLRNVLDDLVADWHRSGGAKVVVSYAGTSALARQIEQGAPADILISADTKWMQYLVDQGMIYPESIGAFARNRVVLVAPAATLPASSAVFDANPPVVNGDFPLPQWLGQTGRFAMADPAHVPAGRYGQAALEGAGLYELVQPVLTRSANVRLALALVARGECPVGLVYASDAKAEPAVRIIGRFVPQGEAPVSYPAGLLKQRGQGHTQANNQESNQAAALLAWLLNSARGARLLQHGLIVPSAG